MENTTLTFERKIKATPAKVFKWLTDPSARQVWNSPDENAIYHVAAPTPAAVGGRETGQVGP